MVFENIGQRFKQAGRQLKTEYDITKQKISTKRDLITQFNFNELKTLYEKETGNKAEIVQKDFNTGKVLSKRAMTRAELENRIFINQRITLDKMFKFKNKKSQVKKPKMKSKKKNMSNNMMKPKFRDYF